MTEQEMLVDMRRGRMLGLDIGLYDRWIFIAPLILLSVGGVTGIEQEAIISETMRSMGIKGKTRAARGLGSGVKRCLGLYPPLPECVITGVGEAHACITPDA